MLSIDEEFMKQIARTRKTETENISVDDVENKLKKLESLLNTE